MTPKLDPKLVRRMDGRCLDCNEQALDGSDYCARCKASAAARQARLRQKRAKAGLCCHGCGRSVGKRRREDGTVIPRRCSKCEASAAARRKRRRIERHRNGAADTVTDPPSETAATRGVVMLEPGKRDGLVVRRYTTDRGRGAPSKEDRRRDALKLIDDAIAALPRYRARLQAWLRDEVQALPRIQRQALLDELLEDAIHAPARMIEGGAEELSELG